MIIAKSKNSRVLFVSLLFTALVLVGCGFHLRGATDESTAIKSVNVEGNRTLVTQMRQPLQWANISIQADAPYQLKLINYSKEQKAATWNGGSIAQYRFSGKLNWALTTDDGLVLIGPQELTGERIYNFQNSSTVTDSLSEQNRLNAEIFAQIAQRITAQLAKLSDADLKVLKEKALQLRKEQEQAAESSKKGNSAFNLFPSSGVSQ